MPISNVPGSGTVSGGASAISEQDIISLETKFMKKYDNLLQRESFILEFVYPGLLVRKIGLVAGLGNVGKSFLMLKQMAALCLGHCFISNTKLERERKIALFSGEDDIEIIYNRLISITKKLDYGQLLKIHNNLNLYDTVGAMDFNVENEIFIHLLKKVAKDNDLIVIDTLSRLHTLDENSNADMSKLIKILESVLVDTNCSILLVHHLSKAGAKNGDDMSATRGADALNSNSRYQLNVFKPTDDNIKIELLKNKYTDFSDDDLNQFFAVSNTKASYSKKQDGKFAAIFRRGIDGVPHRYPYNDEIFVVDEKIDFFTNRIKKDNNHGRHNI
jgi:regulatory protein RepA